jgi:2,4-dienoyl-CoA reductase-like NADH-dependent reductase (Old Yellow Enzyme family)
MAKLFEPITVRSLEVRNRIWIAPMCMYSCEDRDGMPNQWHLVHLGSRASGGAGLVMCEATSVSAEGRITPWCTGIWNDGQAARWAEVNDFIHSQGAKSAIQLAHAGRKASTYRAWSGENSVAIEDGGWPSVSSTDEAFKGTDYATPMWRCETEWDRTKEYLKWIVMWAVLLGSLYLMATWFHEVTV